MDNIKTGALIKELRKEKNLTQKELAERLHITDRAVSKWERGLCAPDISLLEPLSEILDISIVELIEGNRVVHDDYMGEIEVSVKSILGYSKEEIKRKIKTIREKYLMITAACFISVIVIFSFILWRGGYFFVIDKSTSPNGVTNITVYDKNIFGRSFTSEDAISIISKGPDKKETRITYGNCTYQGIWWAPDSQKYVISLKYDDRKYLALSWTEKNSESNLSAYLSIGVQMSELAKYGLQYNDESPLPDIEYQFLQWSLDSTAMLIHYSFTDVNHSLHSGYFWYNCENGNVYATFELDNVQ